MTPTAQTSPVETGDLEHAQEGVPGGSMIQMPQPVTVAPVVAGGVQGATIGAGMATAHPQVAAPGGDGQVDWGVGGHFARPGRAAAGLLLPPQVHRCSPR
jgi:hypothetical protein